MTEKTRLLIYLPKDLDKKLREFLSFKYKNYEKGLLSYEVEQAIKHWIALHTKAQKTLVMKAPNPTPKISRVFVEVKEYLLRKYYVELIPGSTVADVHLREAIAQTRGADPRTIRKWLQIFNSAGLIKRLNNAVWEIL